ncbi:hypothetical protein AVEN_213761-1, partial [Araneus ventricosus]
SHKYIQDLTPSEPRGSSSVSRTQSEADELPRSKTTPKGTKTTDRQRNKNRGPAAISIKPATHFTDKLYILEREKEKAIKIYGNQPNGLPWLEFRLH